MMLSKNVNNKKCAPKLVFFNEKKWERFGWFDIENWLWNQILALFENLLTTPILKIQYVDS